MALNWLSLALLCLVRGSILQDGVSVSSQIDSPTGGFLPFSFNLTEVKSGWDLVFSQTSFSDYSDPVLFLAFAYMPEEHHYEHQLIGSNLLTIGKAEVKTPGTYFLRLNCTTFCRVLLTVRYNLPTDLQAGAAVRDSLLAHEVKKYTFRPNSEAASAQITVIPAENGSGAVEVNVTSEDGHRLKISEVWIHGIACLIPKPAGIYLVSVSALAPVDFLILGESQGTVIDLIAGKPTPGTALTGSWTYYKFHIPDPAATAYVSLTVNSGVPKLFLRPGAMPSASEYTFLLEQQGAITLTAELRSSLAARVGWYYVGVWGVVAGNYVLTVSVNPVGFVPLTQGLPLFGELDPQEFFYYSIIPSQESNLNITIFVRPIAGTPDLYVKLCTEFNAADCLLTAAELTTGEGLLWKGENLPGPEKLSFRKDDEKCYNKLCRYVICLYDQQSFQTSYYISAEYSPEVQHYLAVGQPVSLSIASTSPAYLWFEELDARVVRLAFQVTVQFGTPLLCFSNKVAKPLPKDCERSISTKTLSDFKAEFVKGVDRDSLTGRYFIAVRTGDRTELSIVAREVLPDFNSTIMLYPGQAQRDSLVKNDTSFRLYNFDIRYTPDTMRPIVIQIRPILGQFQLFVANSPNTLVHSSFYFNWSSPAVRTAYTLTLDPYESAYRLESTYELLVQVANWDAHETADYLIWYSSGEGITTLTEGIPVTDKVELGQYHYYLLRLTEQASVTLVLSEVYGDPDLYASLSIRKPNTILHDYAKTVYGGETLVIDYTKEMEEACHKLVPFCTLYIAVYGYSEAKYTLLARSRPTDAVLVDHGTELQGSLNQSESDYFYTAVDTAKPLKVAVQVISGYMELYHTFSADPISHIPDTQQKFTAAGGFEPLLFGVAELQYPEVCHGRCFVAITVLCKEGPECQYLLLVLQGEDVELVENRPVHRDCSAADPSYFTFFVDRDVATLTFTLAALTTGDPDIYVSRKNRPNTQDYLWSATAWRNDLLEVEKATEGSLRGLYYVAIYCDSELKFTLTATVDKTAMRKAAAGKPVYARLSATSTAYFFYTNYLTTELAFSLTSENSPVTVRIATSGETEDIYERLPNNTFSYWESSHLSSDFRMHISPSDPHFCTQCNFIIAVSTANQSSAFSLLVHSGEQPLTLLNGQPHRVEAQNKSEHRFVYELRHKSDIAISLTQFAGSANLYVGTFPHVTSKIYNWTVSADTTLHIKKEERAFHLGWYHLLVITSAAADFTLTVHSRDSVVELVDGWPQTYSLAFDPTDWLLFTYQARKEFSDCRLTPWTKAFQPRVYMDHTSNSMDRVPGPSHSHYSFSNYDRLQGLTFSLPEGTGKYTMAVYGPEKGNETTMGDFQFYCQSRSASAHLSLDEETFGIVDSSSPLRNFELKLVQSGTLEVTVTPCSGLLVLSVLRDYGTEQLHIKQRRVEDGRVVAELQAEEGLYIVRVEKSGEESSFQLIARLRTANQPLSQLMYPGHSGLMHYTLSSKGNISLYWFPLEDSTGIPLPSSVNVRYRVYLRLSPSALMTTACGMHISALRHQATQLSESQWEGNNAIFQAPAKGETVLVNVLALVGAEDDPDVQSVAYQSVEIYVEAGKEGKWLYWGLIGAGIAVIVLGGVVIWLWCRYRQLSRISMNLRELDNQDKNTYQVVGLRSERSGSSRGGQLISAGEVLSSS